MAFDAYDEMRKQCDEEVLASIYEHFVYLQNAWSGCLGNSPYWWAKGGCGYTADIDEAELMTVAEADKIIESTRGSHHFVKWKHAEVQKAIYRTTDIQLLKRMVDNEQKSDSLG